MMMMMMMMMMMINYSPNQSTKINVRKYNRPLCHVRDKKCDMSQVLVYKCVLHVCVNPLIHKFTFSWQIY